MIVARTHRTVWQQVASCYPPLVVQTGIYSWWILGTHNRRATNRGCIKTVMLQSSTRSNRWRTQCLPWSSAWSSMCWLYYHSWQFDFGSGVWGTWDQKHRPKHPDRRKLHRWPTAFRDARGRQGPQTWWWQKWCASSHPNCQPVMTAHNWSWEVWTGNQWYRWVWGCGWWQCGCEWGGRSIASRWWINAKYGRQRAL
jgi:hypothetical protein